MFFVSSVLLRLIKSFDSFQGCHTRNGVVFICSAWIVLRLKEWFVYKINKWLNARTVPLQMSQSNRFQRKMAVELIDIVRRIINFMKVHIWNIRHFTKIKINAAERWICSSLPFHFVCFVYFPLNLIVRVVLMHICNYVNFHFLSVYDHQMWKYSLVKCTVKIMLCIWWNYIKYWCWFGRAANGFGQNVSRSYQFTFNSWNKREIYWDSYRKLVVFHSLHAEGYNKTDISLNRNNWITTTTHTHTRNGIKWITWMPPHV